MSSQMRRIRGALFLLTLQTSLLFFLVESFCYNDHGNYTRNSTYSNNLHTVLSSIPANISAHGFYNGSSGSRNPDIAYAIALCRADVQPQSCRDCIQGLTTRLRTDCTNQKQAVDWDEFCMLRYSNETMLGIRATLPLENATSPTEFTAVVRELLLNLTGQASGGGSLRKVAAGNATGPDSGNPDLSSDECSSCLTEAAANIPSCCNGKTGGRELMPSFNLRYETRLLETNSFDFSGPPTGIITRRTIIIGEPLAPETPSSSPPAEPEGVVPWQPLAFETTSSSPPAPETPSSFAPAIWGTLPPAPTPWPPLAPETPLSSPPVPETPSSSPPALWGTLPPAPTPRPPLAPETPSLSPPAPETPSSSPPAPETPSSSPTAPETRSSFPPALWGTLPPETTPWPPLDFETPSSSPPGPPTRTIIAVVVSIAVCIILAVFVFIHWRKRIRVKKQGPEERHETEEITTVESLKYTLSTLRAATNDFSDDNKLGEGGFGAVYKGKLSNGQEVAVKRLSQNSGQGDLEFKNEVLLMAKLQHRNLVRLLGFCLEGVEKLLVYEFVLNASLDQFIFDPMKRSFLDWEKRYKIIWGIARGILYLHEDSQIRIIHRDLKPSNVLLDGSMNPKIADFGMARLFGQDDTHRSTKLIAGTFGYMAPEYAMNGQFSVKSDVFSFGVLVFEIISGRKNNNLLSFAWKHWNGRTLAELVDPSLRSGSGSISDIVRCIHIGLLCVQEHAADRPTMASIVLMLNSVSMTLAAPTEPAFYAPIDYGLDSSALLHKNNSRGYEYKNSSCSKVKTQSDTSSRNEASIITDLYSIFSTQFEFAME